MIHFDTIPSQRGKGYAHVTINNPEAHGPKWHPLVIQVKPLVASILADHLGTMDDATREKLWEEIRR